MAADTYWHKALRCSDAALSSKALVPLSTELGHISGEAGITYEIRHLTGLPPRHLRASGPKPNPFRPWNEQLQVSLVLNRHVLILNKYPVQIGHMLLITRDWAAQDGWLSLEDWQSVVHVDRDTTGLWFFNSGPSAGASQPHRHLQLLPRHQGERLCPREAWFDAHDLTAQPGTANAGDRLLGLHCFIRHFPDQLPEPVELCDHYEQLCDRAGLGSPSDREKPSQPYNLLLSRRWLALIRRHCEGVRGFSVNALGFAGYLLSTEASDRRWLRSAGPESLLRDVLPPGP